MSGGSQATSVQGHTKTHAVHCRALIITISARQEANVTAASMVDIETADMLETCASADVGKLRSCLQELHCDRWFTCLPGPHSCYSWTVSLPALPPANSEYTITIGLRCYKTSRRKICALVAFFLKNFAFSLRQSFTVIRRSRTTLRLKQMLLPRSASFTSSMVEPKTWNRIKHTVLAHEPRAKVRANVCLCLSSPRGEVAKTGRCR